MAKILVKLTTFIIVIVSLAALTIISSCAASRDSFTTAGKMTAIRRIFPSAVDITEITQDAQISGRPDILNMSQINGDSGLLGYCVESKVVSRSGPFRIRVLLDSQLYVKQATVLSYPWDRGRDVRKLIFTNQFNGKGPEDPIQLGKDIDAITGATISSRIMTEAVRDIIKLLKPLKQ